MTGFNTRRMPGEARVSVPRSAVNDIIATLAKHNPHASRAVLERTGRAAAAFGAAAASLTEEQQKLVTGKRISGIVAAILAALQNRSPVPRDLRPVVPQRTEEAIGAGLGAIVDRDEGRRRLDAYATPTPIEAWAGPVAGPSELARRGVKQSTLQEWRKRGAVIGLLKGERKHVYPLERFIDARPLQGMARIVGIIGDPRAAWLWLRRPHPAGDGTSPLLRLRDGRIEEVVELAERDFG